MPLLHSPTTLGHRLQQILHQLFRAQVNEINARYLNSRFLVSDGLVDMTHWNGTMAGTVQPVVLQLFRSGLITGAHKIHTVDREPSAVDDAVRRLHAETEAMRRPRLGGILPALRPGKSLPGTWHAPGEPDPCGGHHAPEQKGYGELLARLRLRSVFRGGFRPVAKEGSIGLRWDIFNPRWIEAVDSASMIFVRETNETAVGELNETIAKLRRQLKRGLKLGEGLGYLAMRVRKLFLDPARAWRIAATESKRAIQTGEIETYKESGVVSKKGWLASSDACDLCLALDGQERDLDEPFWVNPKGGVYAVVLAPPRHPHCFL